MTTPNPTLESAARAAYEADVREMPTYHDGAPRVPWERLCAIARWSWERNPSPRWSASALDRLQGGAP